MGPFDTDSIGSGLAHEETIDQAPSEEHRSIYATCFALVRNAALLMFNGKLKLVDRQFLVAKPAPLADMFCSNPGVMTRHYFQGYKHQVISLMVHYVEKGPGYTWHEERSWLGRLSEPEFKHAFDKMEVCCELLVFYGEYHVFGDRSHFEGFIFDVWRMAVKFRKFNEADAILDLVVDACNRVYITYNSPTDTCEGLFFKMAHQMVFNRDEYSHISIISQRGGPPKLWSPGYTVTVWVTNDIKYNVLACCLTDAEEHAHTVEYASGRDDEYELALPEV